MKENDVALNFEVYSDLSFYLTQIMNYESKYFKIFHIDFPEP